MDASCSGDEDSHSELDLRSYVLEGTQIFCHEYWWVNYVADPDIC